MFPGYLPLIVPFIACHSKSGVIKSNQLQFTEKISPIVYWKNQPLPVFPLFDKILRFPIYFCQFAINERFFLSVFSFDTTPRGKRDVIFLVSVHLIFKLVSIFIVRILKRSNNYFVFQLHYFKILTYFLDRVYIGFTACVSKMLKILELWHFLL